MPSPIRRYVPLGEARRHPAPTRGATGLGGASRLCGLSQDDLSEVEAYWLLHDNWRRLSIDHLPEPGAHDGERHLVAQLSKASTVDSRCASHARYRRIARLAAFLTLLQQLDDFVGRVEPRPTSNPVKMMPPIVAGRSFVASVTPSFCTPV